MFFAGSEDVMVVVLQDYPSPQISEPIYRMGEKLRVLAQYDLFLHSWLKDKTVFHIGTHTFCIQEITNEYEEIKTVLKGHVQP